MLLTIHDNQYRKVAFIDNEKQGTLNYFNDRWHRNLETGSSTFEFSVSKKDVEGDKAYSRVYQQLNEKAYISFQHKSRNYIFYVSKVVETHTKINCLCLNLNLDLINSEVGAFKATRAMSFAEYCNAMGLLRYEKMSIGINEVSESRRTLEWDGTESKVARLISLARNFEAEIDFDTQFYDDSSLKSFKVNVYKAYDGEKNQGVGRRRDDLLLVRGVNLAEVKRTVDNSKIYNAVTPVGKNGERVIQLAPSNWSVTNEKGELEFYQKGGTLYAPLSAQRFPSAFPDKESGEQWITRTMEIDSADQEKIRSTAYRELKKFAYPEITYEVEGYADLNIGDTVRIQDDGFVPMLVIEARVIEQTLSFTNPSSNRTTFGNARALESRVSTDLIKRLEQMVESARPYTIKVLTSNGTYFKNGLGHSVVEARLYKGGTPIEDVTWAWEFKGQSATGQSFQVDGREVGETAVLVVKATQGDRELTREAVSFVNVNDGASGQPGQAGADGRTPIVHTAYANSADGSVGFSVSDSTNKSYIGTCTTYLDTNPTGEDPRDYRLYSWAKFKGETGRGIESTTHYFLATNQGSGVTVSTSGWTTTAQSTTAVNKYLWNYTVTQYTDGTSQTSSAIIIGVHGADGRTTYPHYAFSDNADGTGLVFTDTGQRYQGYYSDYTQADSTDKTKYRWADRWAKIEAGGRNYVLDSRTVWVNTNNIQTCPISKEQLKDGSREFIRIRRSNPSLNPSLISLYSEIRGFSSEMPTSGKGKISFKARASAPVNMNVMGILISSTSTNLPWDRSQISIGTEWKTYSFDFEFVKGMTILRANPLQVLPPVPNLAEFYLDLCEWQLEAGTMASSWSQAPEDVEESIRKEAEIAAYNDLKLQEEAQAIRVELEAKALASEIKAWLGEYHSFVERSDGQVAGLSQSFFESQARIVELEKNLGENALMLNFVNNYLRASDDGVTLGNKDNTDYIQITPEGIQLMSAGVAVATIANGLMKTAHGVLTDSLQVGKFRFEQSRRNPDINVWRYVE
ncbi:phage tail spike protein [Streptococcus suis]|uniref:phage tail spike protein n=1 Tax=Streptococcus suis TaxID=1307 RepID=UPI0014797E08